MLYSDIIKNLKMSKEYEDVSFQPMNRFYYIVYSNGELIQIDNKKEAEKAGKIVDEKETAEYIAYKDKQNKFYAEVENIWISELKKDFNESDEIFNICYDYLYENYHSNMDDIIPHMNDLKDLITRLKPVLNKK